MRDFGGFSAMLAVHDEPAFIEVELAAGQLCCPSCAAPLGPWG